MDIQKPCRRCGNFTTVKVVVNRSPALYDLTNWLINMKSVSLSQTKRRLGSRGRPEESRNAILKAAILEFSRGGLAGARTDAIARTARVNKALLYYYYKDKDALYGAVLDLVFGGLTQAVDVPLSSNLPPREKLLAYAGAHFDYIAGHPNYPGIVQREMMSVGRGRSVHIERVVKQYFSPLFARVAQVVRDGIEAGEFRAVNPMEFVASMVSTIVFYFINAPLLRLMMESDPLSPERIAQRRAAVLDFISAALFRDRSSNFAGARS